MNISKFTIIIIRNIYLMASYHPHQLTGKCHKINLLKYNSKYISSKKVLKISKKRIRNRVS